MYRLHSTLYVSPSFSAAHVCLASPPLLRAFSFSRSFPFLLNPRRGNVRTSLSYVLSQVSVALLTYIVNAG